MSARNTSPAFAIAGDTTRKEPARIVVLERREVAPDGSDLPYRGRCRRCNHPFALWYNGGELDTHHCCGIRYELRHEAIAFVASIPLAGYDPDVDDLERYNPDGDVVPPLGGVMRS